MRYLCGGCSGTRYWLNDGDVPICTRCHPPASQAKGQPTIIESAGEPAVHRWTRTRTGIPA